MSQECGSPGQIWPWSALKMVNALVWMSDSAVRCVTCKRGLQGSWSGSSGGLSVSVQTRADSTQGSPVSPAEVCTAAALSHHSSAEALHQNPARNAQSEQTRRAARAWVPSPATEVGSDPGLPLPSKDIDLTFLSKCLLLYNPWK